MERSSRTYPGRSTAPDQRKLRGNLARALGAEWGHTGGVCDWWSTA